MKIRFIEPGNLPYRKSIKNLFVYDKYIRTPSNGIITLATILKKDFEDVYCYSESISKIVWRDVLDADIIFISIFTFNANRGYELASYTRKNCTALIVFGGLHATLNYVETAKYCDYVLLGEGDEVILQFSKTINEKAEMDVPGVVFWENGNLKKTCDPIPPTDIDTIPNRNLLYNFKKILNEVIDLGQCNQS